MSLCLLLSQTTSLSINHQNKNSVNIYQNNLQQYQDRLLKLASTQNQLSILRLVAFICSAVLITMLANERQVGWVLIVVPLCLLGFGVLIRRYNRVAYLKRHTTHLKEINALEILRSENKLSGFPTGQALMRRDHAYVADLDIFGSHSLFQMINRATTESGDILLAKWLSEPAANEVILERQQAIQELTPQLDWRQDFQASGMHFSNAESAYHKLLTWVAQPVQLLPHQAKYLVACIILSVLSTAAAAYYLVQAFTANNFTTSLLPLSIILTINYLILRKIKPIAEEIIDNTHQNIKILGGYQALITKIESGTFHTPILRQLQSTFRQQHYSASGEINKLKKILEIFQLRGSKRSDSNKFYLVFNLFWLLDIYWILLTEKWKLRNRSHLSDWAAAVSEFEVLSSLAGFAYSNPSFTFPTIQQEPYFMHFDQLGHPLINPESRVCNDFHLAGRGEIAMITGSNMAGKSTFLRTLGVNLALALMGAPCCATSGRVSNMKVFTSMRTQDNLEEGVSSFYAELKRIEQLLNLIRSGEAIFFMLDEMFKGTNSQDRHKGGFSLIKQLSELNAFGMISTHDLALAKLAGNHAIVTNFSFNSEIQRGEMLFNYTLTEGICQDFNASELMKKSGIKILTDIEDL
ncbi:MAG: DNA mismatch repair protein MutS [Cyclobacteriaceae bacterium]